MLVAWVACARHERCVPLSNPPSLRHVKDYVEDDAQYLNTTISSYCHILKFVFHIGVISNIFWNNNYHNVLLKKMNDASSLSSSTLFRHNFRELFTSFSNIGCFLITYNKLLRFYIVTSVTRINSSRKI